jgi:hypothetical protein
MLLIIYAIATENFCGGAKNGPGLATLGAATAIEKISYIQWFIRIWPAGVMAPPALPIGFFRDECRRGFAVSTVGHAARV